MSSLLGGKLAQWNLSGYLRSKFIFTDIIRPSAPCLETRNFPSGNINI